MISHCNVLYLENPFDSFLVSFPGFSLGYTWCPVSITLYFWLTKRNFQGAMPNIIIKDHPKNDTSKFAFKCFNSIREELRNHLPIRDIVQCSAMVVILKVKTTEQKFIKDYQMIMYNFCSISFADFNIFSMLYVEAFLDF